MSKLKQLRRDAERAAARKLIWRPHRWQLSLVCLFSLALLSPPAKPHPVYVAVPKPQPAPAPAPAPVFLVEHQPDAELYSNGLKILLRFETTGAPRSYVAYDRATLRPVNHATRPVGIVFHTTESLAPAIRPDQVEALSRTREDVLNYVRHDRLYNYVISRFGEVYRVVPEDQTAFHAGHSVWADDTSVYIGLNESFLGVSFEMNAAETATAAQRQAGKLLTELLRSRYGIPDGNCVTHAQVSINPEHLLIGYHTDWGGSFPFADIGLTVGYSAPIAAVEVFGFNYDQQFLQVIGGRPWEGLIAAEQQILTNAAARGILSSRYRSAIQQQFQTLRRRHNEKP